MIPVGFSSSMNYFVGKYVGRNRIDLARKIFFLGQIIGFTWSFASMATCLLFKQDIFDFYTSKHEI